MPDSGTIAGIGYAEEAKRPLEVAIVRNRYVGRTFIQPTQKVRDLGVKMKLNPISEVFKDKKAVIVDDSIVRGTTAGRIVKLIRESGASEVHMRIASPPVCYPCPYGIDTRKKGTLAAVQMTIEQLRQKIDATTLHYLSSEDLVAAIGLPEDRLCTACFTGKYLKENDNKENL
jgi:amidophosphoribosyltransferase